MCITCLLYTSISYTRYLLDCGITGGLPELYAAVTPCALGYAQVAHYITENYPKLPSNPYQAWIDTYSAPEYQQAAQETVDFLTVLCEMCIRDSRCNSLPP